MIQEAIFDVETQKLFSEVAGNDPALLGVSLLSVYIRQVDEEQQEVSGEMRSFWEHELADFWPLLAGVKRIIGFNSIKFDVQALKPYAPTSFARLPHFDIMQSVRDALGHNLSLRVLSEQSLGATKTDVGTNAVTYWKSQDPGELKKLRDYCEADVFLTRDLYDFGVRNKKLKYMDRTNTAREFAVDFSYPREVIDASRQMGLF